MRLIALCFLFAALSWFAAAGCGGDDDGMTPADAGPSDAAGDAGGTRDAGRDAGGMRDAGPTGCTTDCELVELALGLEHSCVRRESGEVLCWGANHYGQLGDGRMRHAMECTFAMETDIVDCAGPVVTDVTNAAMISAKGAFSTCAVDDAGALWCWGYEGVPEVIGGERRRRYVPEMVDLPGAPTDLSDGWLTACAVVGGEVYCLADNDSGQAGRGNTTEQPVPMAVPGLSGIVDVEVSVFGGFVCARSATEVWCWGSNAHGQLGDDRTDHGVCMDHMGGSYDCALTPASITPLNDLTESITQLALGASHACALTDAGTVYCWGQGVLGQLGQDDDAFMASRTPLLVPGLSGVTQVVAGGGHTCALLDTGAIKCWGLHNEGQLGDGVPVNDHTDVCELGSSTYDCTDTPTDVVTIDDATFIAAGDEHTCAIRGTAAVWCWGINDRIQLGIGGTGAASRERRVAPEMVLGIP